MVTEVKSNINVPHCVNVVDHVDTADDPPAADCDGPVNATGADALIKLAGSAGMFGAVGGAPLPAIKFMSTLANPLWSAMTVQPVIVQP